MKYLFSTDNTNLIITLDTESGKYNPEITTVNDPNVTLENDRIWFYENGKYVRNFSFDHIGTISGVTPTSIADAFTKLNAVIDGLYLLVSPNFKGSIVPTDTPTGTEDAVWIATQAGTYTNFGGKVVSANSRAEISRVGGVFSISQTPLVIPNTKIPAWTAISFASGDQVNYLGKDWVSNAATVAGDVPGTSSKWVERLSGYKINIDTTWVEGNYINTDGVVYSDASYRVTGFIDVLESRSYVVNNGHNICFFDKEKTLISALTNVSSLTTPSGCVYVRFSTTKLSSLILFYDNISFAANYASKGLFNKLTENLTKLTKINKIIDGFYLISSGDVITNAALCITDYMLVTELTSYRTNASHVILFYTKNRVLITQGSLVNGKVTSPALAFYCRLTNLVSTKNELYFYNENDSFYNVFKKEDFYGFSDIKKSLYNTVSDLNSLSAVNKVGGTVVGTSGTEGAVYTLPVFSVGGEYRLSFDIRLPKDIHSGETSSLVEFASIPFINGSDSTHGAFKMSFSKLKPSTQYPYAQPKFNAGIIYQAVKTYNVYRSEYFPETSHKQFVGEDVFSVRFKGDVNLAINQDVCLTISDSGILVYHSTDNSVILSESFPVSKSMNEFRDSLISKTDTSGIYFNLIEFQDYYSEALSTDDLVRFSSVPLVANYNSQVIGKGYNAFPCFVTSYDNSFHNIELVFNYSTSNISLFIDGFKTRFVDGSFAFNLGGVFDSAVTIGGSGCIIKNFKFENYVTKTSHPKIIVYMAHTITGGVRKLSNGDLISEGRIKEIIRSNNEAESKPVSIEDIESFLYFDKKLPNKGWSIIHDDAAHLSDTTNLIANRIRYIYSKNAVRPSFCLINSSTNLITQQAVLKDKDLHNFHLHDNDHSKGLSARTYTDLLSTITEGLKGFRDLYYSTRYITYPFGMYDINILKLLPHLGVSMAFLAGEHTGKNLPICRRYHNLALPRVGIDDKAPMTVPLDN